MNDQLNNDFIDNNSSESQKQVFEVGDFKDQIWQLQNNITQIQANPDISKNEKEKQINIALEKLEELQAAMLEKSEEIKQSKEEIEVPKQIVLENITDKHADKSQSEISKLVSANKFEANMSQEKIIKETTWIPQRFKDLASIS